ncbi:MAG: hypothetical protein MUC47_10825 [Candidatus Kapabacteria bacterium]|nr:hypothetical protein [Candidatus Kapabacteria bacterium]
MIVILLLLCVMSPAAGQSVRLPLPPALSTMGQPYSMQAGLVMASPTSIWTSQALGRDFVRVVIDPTQRDVEIVRVTRDTIDAVLTAGPVLDAQRIVYRSTNGGSTWNRLEQLPSVTGRLLATNGVVHLFQAPVLAADTSHAVYAFDCQYQLIQRFETSIPLRFPIGGQGSSDTLWICSQSTTTENSTWALGGVAACNPTSWTPQAQPAVRRVFAVPTAVMRQVADTIYADIASRRETWAMPVTQGFAIEPEMLVLTTQGPVMSYRGRLWRYESERKRWTVMLSAVDFSERLTLFALGDTLVVHAPGFYPWAGTIEGTTFTPAIPMGNGLADATAFGLRGNGSTVALLSFGGPSLPPRTVISMFETSSLPRIVEDSAVMAFRRLVGHTGAGEQTRFWFVDDALYSVGRDGDIRKERDQAFVPIIAAMDVGGGTIVADVQQIQIRRNGEWQTWYGPGLVASDVFVMRDTVVVVSIDPGTTTEDQRVSMILLRSDGTAIAVNREVYRLDEGSVYTWMVPTAVGLLHRAGPVLRLSTDAGRSWSMVPRPLDDMVRPVERGGVLWSAGRAEGRSAVCWSFDGGQQWQTATIDIPEFVGIESIALTPSTLVLATSIGLYECTLNTVSAPKETPTVNVEAATLFALTGERSGTIEQGRTTVQDGIYVLRTNETAMVVQIYGGVLWAVGRP